MDIHRIWGIWQAKKALGLIETCFSFVAFPHLWGYSLILAGLSAIWLTRLSDLGLWESYPPVFVYPQLIPIPCWMGD